MSTLGERMHELRNARGWSRNKLAREAGVSQGYLSDLENGKKDTPSGIVLAKLAAVLGTSTDFLLGLSNNASVENHLQKLPVTNFSFSSAGWEMAALLTCLDSEQQNAVINLVHNLARPKLSRAHPWLKRLPSDLQERMLPLLAAGWLHRYIYTDARTLEKWDVKQLENTCQAMLADYEKIWSAKTPGNEIK